MRYVFTLLFVLFGFPAFVAAQVAPAGDMDTWLASGVQRQFTGYRRVCNNGICTQQAVYSYVPVRAIAAAANPVTVTTATYQLPVAPIDPTVSTTPLPAAPVTVGAGQVCNCNVTGVCTCNPGTCSCPNCMNGTVRMGSAAPVTQFAAGPYTYYSVAAPTVMTAATTYASGNGVVTRVSDAFGNTCVAHSAGRRATRWLAKGIRRGWSN